MTRKLTEIKVYWDSQDPSSEGWACKAYYSDEHEYSFPIDTVDNDDLDGAIMEACFTLGVELTHDDFAKSDEEGGVADWMADEDTTRAQDFAAKYNDTNDLMTALDAAQIESEQDWDAGTTTWTFEDGSQIVIDGSEVVVK